MKRWDPSAWKNPLTKKPPPEHGIKVKKIGTTWWGKLWIEALEHVLLGDAGRLARGKTYARAGRTHDLAVHGGRVTAKVTGSRDTPYDVGIRMSELAVGVWKKAIAEMAEKAQFAAELLAGEMPKDIDAVFRAAGASLFPRQRKELVTTCSCPDWGDPCKHVAATHYVLGEAFDRDPFLLFELRGRTKAQVLEALRAARGGNAGVPAKASGEPAPSKIAGVTLEKVTAADYDRAPEALPSLSFSFEAPSTHGAVLKQLGAPAAWNETASPADALSPLVRRAADAARRIALAESPPPNVPTEPPRKKQKGRRKA